MTDIFVKNRFGTQFDNVQSENS